MKKCVKMIIMMLFSLFVLNIFVGCNNNSIREIEKKDIVSIRIGTKLSGQSSMMTFKCTLENFSFKYIINNSLADDNLIEDEIICNSGEYFTCIFKAYDQDNNLKEVTEDFFIDVIIYNFDKIVGFVVLEVDAINYPNQNLNIIDYFLYYVTSKVFVDNNNQYVSVTEEYVMKRINDFHI